MRIITGWGRTETDELSDVLREIQLPVVTKKTCSMAARKLGAKITDRMLCVGGGTKDTCDVCINSSLVHSPWSYDRSPYAIKNHRMATNDPLPCWVFGFLSWLLMA